MVFVIGLVRDTGGAIVRICIILAQNRLLSFAVQKHGNTLASISPRNKILNLFAVFFSSQAFYLKKFGSLKNVGNETLHLFCITVKVALGFLEQQQLHNLFLMQNIYTIINKEDRAKK